MDTDEAIVETDIDEPIVETDTDEAIVEMDTDEPTVVWDSIWGNNPLTTHYTAFRHSGIRPRIPYKLVDFLGPGMGLDDFKNKYKWQHRSGFTPPLVPLVDEPPMAAQARKSAKQDEEHQKARTANSYTTRELLDWGAVEEEVLPSDLNDSNAPLNPIFKRENWIPPPDKDCLLDPSKDNVWAAMMPSLRLASLILSDSALWPWWDTLIYSCYLDLDTDDHLEEVELQMKRIKPRPSKLRRSADQERWWNEVQDDVAFTLFNPYSAIHGNRIAYAKTLLASKTIPENKKILTMMAKQWPETLLKSGLSESQRLRCVFFWALTLCHEVSHAVHFIAHGERRRGRLEPFFGNDICAELGFAFESAVLGGTVETEPTTFENTIPILMLESSTWPTFKDYFALSGGQSHLIYPGYYPEEGDPFSTQMNWIMPISHMADLQQIVFWEYKVRQYGAVILKDFLKWSGAMRTYKDDETESYEKYEKVWGKVLERLFDPPQGDRLRLKSVLEIRDEDLFGDEDLPSDYPRLWIKARVEMEKTISAYGLAQRMLHYMYREQQL